MTQTLPQIVVNGRAVRWNPDRPRHSWERVADHTRVCRWCRTSTLAVNDVAHSGLWWTVWQQPGQPPRDTRQDGPVPVCGGPRS